MPEVDSNMSFFKPLSVEEAIKMAVIKKEGFRFLAGGTDVMVNKFQGTDKSTSFIDITGIEELKTVRNENGYLKIGALLKLDSLESFDEIRNEFPALISAAKSVGSPVIRKSATLAGNLLCENRCSFFNQSEWWREAVGYCLKCEGDVCIATGGTKNCFSKFVSDTAPVLIGLNALVEIKNDKGTVLIKVEDLYTGDGVNSNTLNQLDIITCICIPLNQNAKVVFKKLRQRETLEFTSLTSVVSLDKNGHIRIVLSGVDPKPILIEGESNQDVNELIVRAIKKSRIIDNDVFPRKYRKEMIGVYLKRSFEELEIKLTHS